MEAWPGLESVDGAERAEDAGGDDLRTEAGRALVVYSMCRDTGSGTCHVLLGGTVLGARICL